MAYKLEQDYVLLDGNEFATSKNTETNRHYFDERIANKGILNFGLVRVGEEQIIDLQAEGINSPVIIDSVVAFSSTTEADEIYFNLYFIDDGKLIRSGRQRYSNAQMPVEFPDGIIKPGTLLGVAPRRADTAIYVYTKPVQIIYEAVPTYIKLKDGTILSAKNKQPSELQYD